MEVLRFSRPHSRLEITQTRKIGVASILLQRANFLSYGAVDQPSAQHHSCNKLTEKRTCRSKLLAKLWSCRGIHTRSERSMACKGNKVKFDFADYCVLCANSAKLTLAHTALLRVPTSLTHPEAKTSIKCEPGHEDGPKTRLTNSTALAGRSLPVLST